MDNTLVNNQLTYIVLKQNSVSDPLISVIIPFYNVEKYFEDRLQSVLNQTEKRLELICVDDRSTDSSSPYWKTQVKGILVLL